VNPTDQVSLLINCLTKDEDQRQDLWVHYLSGNSPSTFVSYLEKLNMQYASSIELQKLLWSIASNPPSDKFKQLLANFSEVEQSIVCLLALGLSISEISGYKAIAEIRIRHVISIVKDNACWEELYGKEKWHLKND
jgi:hypothetical protein